MLRAGSRHRIVGMLIAIALAAGSSVVAGGGAVAADPPPAAAPDGNRTSEPAPDPSPGAVDMEALTAQLKRIGELFREIVEAAAEAAKARKGPEDAVPGGSGSIAPEVRPGSVAAIYGPEGPTVRTVSALLAYRVVLTGNPRLKAGRVYERDGRIMAEVVTAREGALVARYMIDRHSGVWVPEGSTTE